ncbi:MAG: hypothetical protein Q7V10_03300 [Methanobacteriaceae archaeon]|nr:hypothetical protein [Methanobacteriaceae archaeon]MDO9626238.1 hypothetical protein [Methanobacteriaceae archaeon]
MNYRIILVLMVICLFAVGLGAMNFISAKGLTLDEAYNAGNVVITQQTPAGTIPHEINIQNKGKNPVNVQKGTILSSKDSQDLVIARDEVVSPNTKITVPAYCIEPDQKAIENKKLTVSGLAPQVITEIASSSNPENPSDALNAQLKIWTIVGGPDFNIYTGEVAAVSQKQDISFYDIKGNLSNAKIEVMTKFNLTADQMNNVNINSSILNQSQSFTEQVTNWFSGLGLNL